MEIDDDDAKAAFKEEYMQASKKHEDDVASWTS